jgi:enamine deaminase RidA (YjgF/YER057c/UK114 family)
MAPDPIDRPAAPPAQGLYVPAKRFGDLVFVSGMTPRVDGKLIQTGHVTSGANPEDYRAAVELATRNALAAAGSVLAEGEELHTPVNLTVYVNAAPDYAEHSRIADFASAVLAASFGGDIPSRAAVGVSSLPGGAPVEVALVLGVRRSVSR